MLSRLNVSCIYCSKTSHGEKYFISQGIGMKCDICDKLMVSGLWNHKKTHHNYKHIPCPQCGVTVKDTGLRRHIERMHTDRPASYSCNKCDKTWKTIESFTFHLVAEHNDTSLGNRNVFTCEYCQLKFDKSWNLELHIKVVHGK